MHLMQISNQIAATVKVRLAVIKRSGDEVIYEIPPFLEGEPFRNRLHDLLVGDVGIDRADILMARGNFMYAGQFSDFGKQRRQIEIRTKIDQGLTTVYMKESYDGRGSNRSDASSLPGRLALLLPAAGRPSQQAPQ